MTTLPNGPNANENIKCGAFVQFSYFLNARRLYWSSLSSAHSLIFLFCLDCNSFNAAASCLVVLVLKKGPKYACHRYYTFRHIVILKTVGNTAPLLGVVRSLEAACVPRKMKYLGTNLTVCSTWRHANCTCARWKMFSYISWHLLKAANAHFGILRNMTTQKSSDYFQFPRSISAYYSINSMT